MNNDSIETVEDVIKRLNAIIAHPETEESYKDALRYTLRELCNVSTAAKERNWRINNTSSRCGHM